MQGDLATAVADAGEMVAHRDATPLPISLQGTEKALRGPRGAIRSDRRSDPNGGASSGCKRAAAGRPAKVALTETCAVTTGTPSLVRRRVD